jgi:polysaccharide export outer membrane protein
MRFSILIYLFFGIFIVFSSCSYKQDQVLFEQKSLTGDTTRQNAITNITNYHIQPQDILQIRNLQNSKNLIDMHPSLSGSALVENNILAETFQVEDDGTIALTGLGHVQVAGLTRYEAGRYIEGLYSKNLLQNPIIELKIMNLKVTIMGEIKAPGNIPLTKDRNTLIEMLGAAGGLTDKANEKDIQIIRGGKNPVVTHIDLSNLKSLTDPRTIMQNNDIVYITQNKRAVRADKTQTFNTIIQPALIIINTALIILSLASK